MCSVDWGRCARGGCGQLARRTCVLHPFDRSLCIACPVAPIARSPATRPLHRRLTRTCARHAVDGHHSSRGRCLQRHRLSIRAVLPCISGEGGTLCIPMVEGREMRRREGRSTSGEEGPTVEQARARTRQFLYVWSLGDVESKNVRHVARRVEVPEGRRGRDR